VSQTPDKKALSDSVNIYEQILQKMPSDIYSIEELIDIYEKMGDAEKVTAYKNRLGQIERGEELTPIKTATDFTSDPKVISVRQSSKISNRKVSLKARPQISDPVPPSWRRKNQELDQIKLTKALSDLVFTMQYSMKSQVDLMISLYDVGIISHAQFSEVMYKLADHKFSRDPQKPEMVMHMLEACEGVDLEKVYYFLSKKSHLPYIDLSVMVLNAKLFELFPVTLVYNHGIVIFKRLGNEYCVAVLNPINTELMQHTVDLLGENVHFFLTSSSEFDLFLKKHGRARS
jgi:hypothetical protein